MKHAHKKHLIVSDYHKNVRFLRGYVLVTEILYSRATRGVGTASLEALHSTETDGLSTSLLHVLDTLFLIYNLLLYRWWHVLPQLHLEELARLCDVFDPVVLRN